MKNMADEKFADHQAARTAIGKDLIKVLFTRKFKYEGGKGDKGDPRILAITPYRLYIISTKHTPKVEFSFHILEIHSMDGSQSMAVTYFDTYLFQLNLDIYIGDKGHHQKFLFENEDDVGKIISYVIALLKTNFVNADVEKQLSWKVSSPEKEKSILQHNSALEQSLSGEGQPCGSFTLAYLCMCDFYKQVSNQCGEVCWDIDKIYASHRCTDFKLDDFDHLDMKDMIPLIAALAYNTWFTCLTVSSTKLSNEVIDTIMKVIKRSLSIQEIVLSDCHLNKDQIQKLGLVLGANSNKVIKRLDFSRNNLEDKGVATITGTFGNLNIGLESLNFSEVGMTSKGCAYMANCLKKNKLMATTLTTLNISGNPLKSEGIQLLCDFFSQPNALESISLSNTECPLDLLFSALHHGCQLTLKDLDLSGNPFTTKKSKDTQMLSSFQQFFSMSRAIKSVNLSNTKIHASGMKAILVGLLNNPSLHDVGLDLSNNELKSNGAAELSSCLKEISLSKLNLANNGLEQELIQICDALQYNRFIEELDLSHNVAKTKNTNPIAEALAEIIVSESPLKKLSISDCKLRNDASVLFDCLGTNETLTSIDISGNAVGDVGARLLAKALQINTKLKEIHLDRNNITPKGFHAIAQAMERNYSLHSMPIPMTDLAAAMKQNNSNLFSKAYTQIDQSLTRNRDAGNSRHERAYKVHQSLLMGSIDQYTRHTDESVNELEECISQLHDSPNENIKKEIKVAKALVREADSFRQVLLDLYSDPDHSKVLLDGMFNQVTEDVVTSVDSVIKENINKMLKSATNICPIALNKEEHLRNIQDDLIKNNLTEKDGISNSIMELTKSEITYKLCESNLSTATSIAEQLKKLFVDALQNSINTLNTLHNLSVSDTVFESNQDNAISDAEIDDKKADVSKFCKDENQKTDIQPAITEIDLMKEVIVTTELDNEIASALSTPTTRFLKDISGDGNFDLNREFGAKKERVLSSNTSQFSIEDDGDFVFVHRNRLSTNTAYQRDEKKKKASLKRRPTFYRASEKPDFNVKEISFESPPETNLDNEKNVGIVESFPLANMEGVSDAGDVEQQSEYLIENNQSTLKERSKSADELNSLPEKEPTSSASAIGSMVSRSGSILSRQSLSVDDGLSEQGRMRVPSIGAFDDVSTHSNQLSVSKKRIKPAHGRRAPTRVSKLAHMTIGDSLGEDQTNESLEDVTKDRPKSEMIPKTQEAEEHFRLRLSTDIGKKNPPARPTPPNKPDVTPRSDNSHKVDSPSRPERPDRPKKVESEKNTESAIKEKKVKPPSGAFQLPPLPNMLGGILKKRAAPKPPDSVGGDESKSEIGAHPELGSDGKIDSHEDNENISDRGSILVDGSGNNIAPPKPPPPVVIKRPDVEDNRETIASTEVTDSNEIHSSSQPPKPLAPRFVPMGGSALMAEMNKKLNKTPKAEEDEVSTVKPEAPVKPHKPIPPQRPPSLKKSASIDGRPNVPDRPKLMQTRLKHAEDEGECKDTPRSENLENLGDVSGSLNQSLQSTTQLNTLDLKGDTDSLDSASQNTGKEEQGESFKEPFTAYV